MVQKREQLTKSKRSPGSAIAARATALAGVLLGLTLSAGCSTKKINDPPDPSPPKPSASEGIAKACFCRDAEWHPQGIELEGTGINACDNPWRARIPSFSLAGVKDAGGKPVTNVSVANGVLKGSSSADGHALTATEWKGVQLTANATCLDGVATTKLAARITAVEPYAGATVEGLSNTASVYRVEIQNPIDSSWEPACPDGAGAIPSAEVWDKSGNPGPGQGSFTFACVNAAIAKCYAWGYVPWSPGKAGAKTNDLHAACTRMVRADYCGDGRSFTMDGMLINLYDDLGVQSDTESWVFEAEWTTEGARCVSSPRISGKKYTPTCAFEIPAADCGKSIDWSVTLLANEQEQ